MAEVFHERLKSPIPKRELERRTAALQKMMKEAKIDCIVSQNITQYLCGCNRWLTDTTAENNYPQSTILPTEGEVRYIACSGPPLDLYPPSHLLRIGQPYDAAPYFSPFNYTNDWEGQFVARWAKENNARTIGIAGFQMFYWNYYDSIKRNLPGVQIIDVSDMFDELRAIKSDDEQLFIHNSAAVQDKVMGYIPAFAQPGVREYELRSKIMQLLTDHGGEEFIVILGSAPRGERYDLMPSFFQNRTLQQGDQLYVRISSSGPGGMYTTIGRLFSIGCPPTEKIKADWQKVLAAEEFLSAKMVPGVDPETIFNEYNSYLSKEGYKTETGIFAYGQGYDNVERPSIQPGETLKLANEMCMAVNISLTDPVSTSYGADSFLIKAGAAERLHKTAQVIFRT